MKIALAQLNYHIGHFESNTNKIIQAIKDAKLVHADLIIFSELCISGYPARDFFEFNDFVDQCQCAVHAIAKECKGIAAIVGAPTFNLNKKGKPLYNSALLLSEGRIVSMSHKSLLPNYDVFDEYRYFEPNKEFQVIPYKDQRLAITICEDLWNIVDDPLYTASPMDELAKQKPTMIINIASSPFNYEQHAIRKTILSANAKKYKLPLFYVNQVGAQTELLFDGGSMAIQPNGVVCEELAYFNEDLKITDLNDVVTQKKQTSSVSLDKTSLIHDALVMGIKDYFEKSGLEKAIIGLSGGIDSAVVLALAVKALGNKNVKTILLPSQFSSDHSVEDAKKLAGNLNVSYDIIKIEEAFKTFQSLLEPHFKNLPFNIAEENIQARIRGLILMALSNKFGYILLNTSNKSEMAVGYGTLYGDMCGGLSVLGDVYKTEVYALAQHINKQGKIIPENTITKAPSAELKPNQKDQDSLPDYSLLDKILYQYIELRKGPKDLLKLGFDESIIKKTLRLVNMNEYKRYQTPPILRVSPKAFGMGRRMPIVAKYLM